MTAPLRSPAIGDVGGAGPTEPPNMFVRTISTPPGLPWDQARVARLDARAGAPLPLADVVYRLHRLAPWRLGHAARYAACYVRTREIGERLLATATIDGKPFAIEFVSAATRAQAAKRLAIITVVAAATGIMAAGALASALAVRADAQARLGILQQAVDLRWREARTAHRIETQGRALTAIHVRGQAVSDVLNDLAWVARTRTPASHIDALRWNHGYMGIESRGDVAPFGQTDRPILKADKQVRPGVWLWAIGPASKARP